MARNDESFLELDDAAPSVPDHADPTPDLTPVADEEGFLEVTDDTVAARAARGRVVTDDDLRMVTALADDDAPLLAALWPAVPDLLAELPNVAALRERVALARTTLNQVTRRGAEWRARAEVAGAALTRRLDALRRRANSRAVELDDAQRDAACDELRAWHERALEQRIRAEAAGTSRLYADSVRRLTEEARQRGLAEDALRTLTARLQVELLPGEMAPWTPCTALPGEPRTLDAVADALLRAPAQAVAALRDGSLVTWLRANRCPGAIVEAALEAQRLIEETNALDGVWPLAWALGREGVVVDGHAVATPEALLAHLRAARLHESRVATVASVLARWFRREGHGAVAAACEALARGDAHAGLRLRQALGEPLRLGERSVTDTAALVREVLTRPAARDAALSLWRDGTLRAWLDTLPRAKRDALWLDDLAHGPAHEHDEAPFWRGVYRRAPKTALRVSLGGDGRVVRFGSVADLHATARVAAVWEPLKSALRTGELHAWLAVAAPGIALDDVPDAGDDDLRLHALLALLGHTGIVLPWGGAGLAVTTPADLVTAWRRSWQQVEAALARGHVTAWLMRRHPQTGVGPVIVAKAVAAWGVALGVGHAPPGVPALRLALLCGLDELPVDPQRPVVRGGVRGYRKLDALARDADAWTPLWNPGALHRQHGTALLWLARHAPGFGALAASALDDSKAAEGCDEAVVAAGVPVATEALATEREVAERESARLAAEREAARLAAEREATTLAAEHEAARLAAEREDARRTAEREAVRREVERDLARLEAERDAARVTLEREVARVAAERELAQMEAARAMAKLLAERDEARREAERTVARVAREREEARLEYERAAAKATAERDEARLEAERARIERDIARLETEQTQRRAQRAKEFADQDAAEREASRLHAIERERRVAEAEAARLAALEAQCRQEAEREAARIAALETEARAAAEREAARLAALADEARRMADEESTRLAALEEEARREAARRASEAAALAQQLAEEAQRRETAEREAEELARRLLTEREVAREAAWAARKVAAEREVARLEEAERKARALAETLASEAPAEAPTRTQIEALAEIEGALDEAPDAQEVAAIAEEVTEALPERREIRHEALVEAKPLDDAELARVRAVLDGWAQRGRGAATSESHGQTVSIVEAVAKPAFEAHVATRLESRELTFVAPPWREDEVIAVPPEATATGASVDPWALELPEVEAWTTWRAEFLLDAAPVRGKCARCEGGRCPCAHCEGGGTVRCPQCDGRVKIRCARCAGAGEVATERGTGRCPRCHGRREDPCPRCTFGRVSCPRCDGEKTLRCAHCRGTGELLERIAVVQTYQGMAAVSVVRASLPEALVGEVRARDAEALPVVHIEAPEIDPWALARELPHGALGEAVAQLLAEEAARARNDQRVTRQRLIVRRYPAAEVRCEVGDDAYTLWVHGARDAVHAESSPASRRADALATRAQDSLSRESLDEAVDALSALDALGDARADALATALGDAVLAMALRGELFAARDAAAKARTLKGPGCVARLVEVERVLAERLQVRSPWALAEEARGAFERGRDDRCAERLTQLAALDATHAEGRRLADALGQRLAAQSRELLARGDHTAAAVVVARARAVAFAECAAAVAAVAAEVEGAERRARRRAWLPWAVAVAALLLALAALLAR